MQVNKRRFHPQILSFQEKERENRSQLKEIITTFVKDLSKEIFDNFPVVKIRWEQFTPYFNDGSPCEFHLMEIWFSLDSTFRETLSPKQRGWFYNHRPDDDELSVFSEYVADVAASDEAATLLLKDLQEVWREFKSILKTVEVENALKEAFGDHRIITIEKNGFIHIHEYDSHD